MVLCKNNLFALQGYNISSARHPGERKPAEAHHRGAGPWYLQEMVLHVIYFKGKIIFLRGEGQSLTSFFDINCITKMVTFHEGLPGEK